MLKYHNIVNKLKYKKYRWLITGVAGFIGSNLLERLLTLNQKVIGIDNFSTGYQANLNEVKHLVTKKQWSNFSFMKGDICNLKVCEKVCNNVDHVLHQAALGSVPRSIKNPIDTNQSNVNGFLNILVASKNAKVKSFTYAGSSSIYGDNPSLPKTESKIGKQLSPYAVTKYVNEIYAEVFFRIYNFNTIGLRYFNVFGKRQNATGDYAAVIPKWIDSIISNKTIKINGDGKTSRDFCYIENVIQANLLAAMSNINEKNNIYNIAAGKQTTLNELFNILINISSKFNINSAAKKKYLQFRKGDVRHSLASIKKANILLGYDPSYSCKDGLLEAFSWYIKKKNVQRN
jgi:UDP-N-acetylglucosamine 4-epimerase